MSTIDQPQETPGALALCTIYGITYPSCTHGIRIFWHRLACTSPAAPPGELPTCAQLQDHRMRVDFPCALCDGADVHSKQQQEQGSPLPEACDAALVPLPAETQEETLERARLARVASEERMLSEGTTLEIENRRSRQNKDAARKLRAYAARLQRGLERRFRREEEDRNGFWHDHSDGSRSDYLDGSSSSSGGGSGSGSEHDVDEDEDEDEDFITRMAI
ncbi:hypothetical protein MMC26_006168 [Xylographa opegraphella]|nr:hypothetical protein [Xylographa opegraphella]